MLFICLCLVFSLPCVTLIGEFIGEHFYGIFMFILALNVFENIFKTTRENTQNKTTVTYQLFATIHHFSFESVCKSLNSFTLNALYLLLKEQCWTISERFRDKSEIAPLNFIVQCWVLNSCVLQLCYFVRKVYSDLKIFWFISWTHHIYYIYIKIHYKIMA